VETWFGGRSGENKEDRDMLLLALGGALLVPALLITLLVSTVLAPAALFAATQEGGSAAGCPPPTTMASPGASTLSPTSGTAAAETDCINPNGNTIAAVALEMAAHLHGNPDVWYDAGFPQAVITYWEQTCPGCTEWRNGNLQCVMLALAAYGVAGIHPPAAGNAISFWALYASRSGWEEIPAAWAPPGQRGLPQPGDWVVWYSSFEPAVGHIAVVVQVAPPRGGRSGSVVFVEANGPGALVTEPLLPDLTVQTWSGYAVVGYIRHV
jgi:hypothetical protein